MTEKCLDCGADIAADSDSSYCAKCDAILDKKFDNIESNLIVYKELTDAEAAVLKKFDKEDIKNLYLKLYESYSEDGDFDQYEAALLAKMQRVFNLTENEIGADKVVKNDGTAVAKKAKPTVCIKCDKPVLKDDFVFCPYCGISLE